MNFPFPFTRQVRRFLRPTPPLSKVTMDENNEIRLIARPRLESPYTDSNSYSDLEEFMLSPKVPEGISTLWHLGLPIDFDLKLKHGEPLIVILHGAASPDVRLPWLSGGNVTNELRASRLSISDPSLYLHADLNLAWFAGNYAQPDLTEVLISIIKKVMESTKASRLILFGGSGGGYASLRLASMIKGANAVVMNPQTDLEKYHPPHVQKYIDLAWNGDRKLMNSSIKTKLIPDIYKKRSEMSVFYIQNSADTFHMKSHLQPFEDKLKGSLGFYLLQERWREGHTPPPKELIHSVLKVCTEGADPQAITKLGFVEM